MPRKGSEVHALFTDPDLRRWYENLAPRLVDEFEVSAV